MVPTGNYRLLEDWRCKGVIDSYNIAKATAVGLIQQGQQPLRLYSSIYELILPKDLTITLTRFSRDSIYFNLYQKYNKGTDYPTVHIEIQWSKCIDQFPVLEDL